MQIDETTLIEIADYIEELNELVGLKPETMLDVKKAISNHRNKLKKLPLADVIKSVCYCGAEHSNEAKYIGQCNYCLKQI